MQRWEYLTVWEQHKGNVVPMSAPYGFLMFSDTHQPIDHDFDGGDSILHLLPKLGDLGWEMCGVTTTQKADDTNIIYFFKRKRA